MIARFLISLLVISFVVASPQEPPVNPIATIGGCLFKDVDITKLVARDFNDVCFGANKLIGHMYAAQTCCQAELAGTCGTPQQPALVDAYAQCPTAVKWCDGISCDTVAEPIDAYDWCPSVASYCNIQECQDTNNLSEQACADGNSFVINYCLKTCALTPTKAICLSQKASNPYGTWMSFFCPYTCCTASQTNYRQPEYIECESMSDTGGPSCYTDEFFASIGFFDDRFACTDPAVAQSCERACCVANVARIELATEAAKNTLPPTAPTPVPRTKIDEWGEKCQTQPTDTRPCRTDTDSGVCLAEESFSEYFKNCPAFCCTLLQQAGQL